MDVRIAVPEEHITAPILNAGLEMNTRVNEKLIRAGAAPTFEQAIAAGVKWKPEPPGEESFDHGRKVIARKWGDCDDLAPMRAASLRVSGQDPGAQAVVYQSGPHRWHAVVKRSSGQYEDPSQTAGMRVTPGSEAAGIPPAVVGCMVSMRGVNGPVRPFVAVRREDDGWIARTDVPWVGADMALSVRNRGESPATALGRSLRGAAIIGASSGVTADEHLDKMYCLSGLLSGDSARQMANVFGRECVGEAMESLAALAPDILRELREHRAATEGARRHGRPFA
jgi:hypothetical protein